MLKRTKKEKSVFDRMSENLSVSLRTASLVSEFLQEKKISPSSMLIGIVLNDNALGKKALDSMGITPSSVVEILTSKKNIEIVGDTSSPKELKFSKESTDILQKGFAIAQKMSHVYFGTEHLMVAILESGSRKIKKLASLGLTAEEYRKALNKVAIYPIGVLVKPKMVSPEDGEFKIVEYLGRDLVQLAREGKLDPVIGRDEEILQLVNILSRRKKSNPIVVGEAGVGKTVLLEGLAQKVASGVVPPSLRNVRIVSLDVAEIIAGSKMRGDVEEKVLSIIDEITASGDTILFIDEIHEIMGSGGFGPSPDIASVLKPALLQGDFRCIGATTTEEYSKTFESDTALARRFVPIFLNEPSIPDSIKILKKIKPVLEKHHKVRISEESVKLAVTLSERYVTNRYLPDKAIDLLDEAAASKKLSVEKDYGDIAVLKDQMVVVSFEKEEEIARGNMDLAVKLQEQEVELEKLIKKREREFLKEKFSKENEITGKDIRVVISKWTGIPLNTLGSKEKSSLLKLESSLNSQVIGQEDACSVVASAIKRARTGIINADRPWASFLFLGPTGVGKTELAKVLSKELFGDEDNLIQIDMSEMMEMHSVSKLIGSPPGYVGFQEGGWLTEKVKRKPHSVILFDEIEKAHPDVLNVLLQILEYGHLTDGRGRRVNFKNTVVILTSNIGAEEIQKDRVLGFVGEKSAVRSDKEIDKAYAEMKETLLNELRDSLRPELINRIDDVVIFRSLTRKDAREIVKLLVNDLNRRLVEEGVCVELDEKVVGYIVKKAFSEEYGARPLRRFMQDSVENLLADYLLTHNIKKGAKEPEKILVVMRKGKMVIK
ncbi:MAG: ATP-dependent Clp protease ATP-binding subunit [Candidatus Dojkabacteria bacterium]|jgi:ATP-dependent Clp protease ATP-binding subunit ClpC